MGIKTKKIDEQKRRETVFEQVSRTKNSYENPVLPKIVKRIYGAVKLLTKRLFNKIIHRGSMCKWKAIKFHLVSFPKMSSKLMLYYSS